MSTLRVDTIQNAAGTDSPISVPGTAKAWVNFNGTGTVAIRASYNVSSITDNGTGDYTVNFTTAMPDANYCSVAQSGANGLPTTYGSEATSAKEFNTTFYRFGLLFADAVPRDREFVSVAIFR